MNKKGQIQWSDYLEPAKKEGFCLLHQGTTKRWTKIFQNPIQTFLELPAHFENAESLIGYLAYPNPHLKNTISDQRFFGFKSGTTYSHRENETFSVPDQSYETFGKLEQSVTKGEYLKKIKEIKELLKAGEIYQMNYAIRFRKKFKGNPFGLFLKMIEVNPSAFAAFINAGDYQILSNSPERLFCFQKGEIMTQPIKGTIIKFPHPKKQLQKLLTSEKERAELEMITDLARNDIGKICQYGTLKLRKHRAAMELPNLWHTYSEVSGRLDSGISPKQMVEALFPGGSITGCPKKRAMEYIEALEGNPRNIFTGSIGYLQKTPSDRYSFKADFNIAIRTALIKDGFVEYWAGGGIVADSNPEAEYEECLLKAERFLSIL